MLFNTATSTRTVLFTALPEVLGVHLDSHARTAAVSYWFSVVATGTCLFREFCPQSFSPHHTQFSFWLDLEFKQTCCVNPEAAAAPTICLERCSEYPDHRRNNS